MELKVLKLDLEIFLIPKILLVSNPFKLAWQVIINHLIISVIIVLLSPQKNGSELFFMILPSGIVIANFLQKATSKVFKNLITVKITTAEGTTSISATIFDDGIERIVSINGFDNEVAIKGDMILFKNSDVPGVIGSVGTILANNNVNISDFSLAINKDKEALAVILVDNAVSDKTLEELASLEACLRVSYVRL